MAKSSINFKKSSGHSSSHNLRIDEPSYLLPKEYRLENESWQNSKSDKELFELELKNSNRKGGPKPKLENSRWEAVLNLNRKHTLEDVKKVAEHIAKKFNITPTEITIHRDEGRIENGKPVYNFHAHLNFLTYKDGKQNWRKELIKPAALSELQTEVSVILGMERGKVNSKAKRLDHRQYKAVAQEMQYNFREYQSKITALENLTTEQKKELHSLNSAVKNERATIEQLNLKIQELKGHKKALIASISGVLKREQREELSKLEPLEQFTKAGEFVKENILGFKSNANKALERTNILQQENETLKRSFSVLKQDMRVLQATNDEAEAVNNKIKKEIKEVIPSDFEPKKSLKERFMGFITELKETIKAQATEILSLKTQNQELKKDLDFKDTKIEELLDERSELIAKADELENLKSTPGVHEAYSKYHFDKILKRNQSNDYDLSL